MRIDNEEDIVITLYLSDCTKGVYLRWLNTKSEYCYHLFQKGIKSNAVKNDAINIVNFLESADYVNGHHEGTNYPLTKSGQKSVKLYETLVDYDDYLFFESLLLSTKVWMLAEYEPENNIENWVIVNISDGTFARDTTILQDFECMMLLPQLQNQSL